MKRYNSFLEDNQLYTLNKIHKIQLKTSILNLSFNHKEDNDIEKVHNLTAYTDATLVKQKNKHIQIP